MFRGGRRRSGRRRVLTGLLGIASIQFAALLVVNPGTAKAVSCPDTQWAGDYFSNMTLAGPAVGSRCDDDISFDWGEAGPGIGGLGGSGYSVRWTRTVYLEPGEYGFTATADDGIRVLLDGSTVIEGWKDQGPTTYTASPSVAAGQHTIVVEYYQNGGGARAEFSYAPPVPPPSSCAPAQWTAAYFSGTALAGAPRGRCEDAISHDWGTGTPDVPGIHADNFSVRWTRTEKFSAGTVTFTAEADDGIRVYIDDTLVIDQWRDQGPTTFTASPTVTAGDHTVKVEYFEHGGGAVAQVSYAAAAPPSSLTCLSTQWAASYFPNRTLSGAPKTERCESTLSYDYGENGPGVDGVGPYNFSARWSRTDQFRAGNSTFTVTADDGVRVYVDGTLVINQWQDQGPTTYTATAPVTAGKHVVSVEYYQGGGGGLVRAGYTGGGAAGDVPPPPPGGCTGDCQGSWQTLPYDSPVRSVHATVLRTGNVLLVAGSGNNGTAAADNQFVSKIWNPSNGDFADVPTQEDLFCVGHTQLPDGRILLAGGTLAYPTPTTNYKGLASSYIFDPMTGTYTKTNDTPGGGHWYPSLVNLGNGSVFATGGLNENGSGNVAVEMFDPTKGQWKPFNEVPQTYFYWGLYPNMVLMSDGRLFYAGTHTFGNALPDTSGSEIYDVDTGTITDVPGLRDIDFRDQGATVLLPPAQAQKVADFGGGNSYSDLDPTNHTDIIDLSKEDPQWTAGPDLPAAKMYVNAVILPDGKVFETGGAKHNYPQYAVHEASMYDPVANAFTSLPADPADRMYHSEAFLLPDGRVATIGNNPATGDFDLGISIYSPWYMSRDRPTISNAGDQFDYGSTQKLAVSGNIGRVTLIRPASVTHQSDPNQRSVDLPLSGTGTDISVTVPDNPNLLPAGYYMMFAQDMNGVPSVAKWVHVG